MASPFKLSLAEWSLHRLLDAGQVTHLDVPRITASLGLRGVEYVNTFFKDKATNGEFLADMNRRAADAGVVQVMIMCDHEGHLGDPDPAARRAAVDRHKPWVDAAVVLGCGVIRVNALSQGPAEEQMTLVADGLRQLVEYAAPLGIDVVVENHGGWSSDASWLVETIRRVDHPRVGTLPDFGNFRISGPKTPMPDAPRRTYDSYAGVAELMPYARGVSVKMRGYDAHGGEVAIDLARMMRIVRDAGYRGFVGIEHAPEGRELEGIAEVRDALIALGPEYFDDASART